MNIKNVEPVIVLEMIVALKIGEKQELLKYLYYNVKKKINKVEITR